CRAFDRPPGMATRDIRLDICSCGDRLVVLSRSRPTFLFLVVRLNRPLRSQPLRRGGTMKSRTCCVASPGWTAFVVARADIIYGSDPRERTPCAERPYMRSRTQSAAASEGRSSYES